MEYRMLKKLNKIEDKIIEKTTYQNIKKYKNKCGGEY